MSVRQHGSTSVTEPTPPLLESCGNAKLSLKIQSSDLGSGSWWQRTWLTYHCEDAHTVQWVCSICHKNALNIRCRSIIFCFFFIVSIFIFILLPVLYKFGIHSKQILNRKSVSFCEFMAFYCCFGESTEFVYVSPRNSNMVSSAKKGNTLPKLISAQ